MFRLCFGFLIIIILCYSLVILASCGNQIEKKNTDQGVGCISDYNPPGTVKFPLGDEELNTDILEKPGVNEAKEKKGERLQPFSGGKCASSSPHGDPIEDSHMPCRGDTPFPQEVLYSSDSDASPTVQCKKCDLKVVPDGTAVVVRCFECYDIPPPANKKHRIERNLLYLVYFLEIANYTSLQRKPEYLPDLEE